MTKKFKGWERKATSERKDDLVKHVERMGEGYKNKSYSKTVLAKNVDKVLQDGFVRRIPKKAVA